MLNIKTLLIMVIFGFIACNPAPERPAAILPEGYVPTTPTSNAPATSATTTPEPAQNAAGVWHYTCPNGCSGGAGSAIACPAGCGATLAHNQAYHDSKTTVATSTNGVITPTSNDGPIVSSPNNPEPPQNAAGVWHYTCPNGCAGGAGSAVACPAGCGATLAHNSAYHN